MIEKDSKQFMSLIENNNPILKDHRIFGERIMPGVTFFDMLYRLLDKMGYSGNEVELQNIIFKEPIITTAQADKKLRIIFTKKSDCWNISAESRKVRDNQFFEDDWTANYHGEVHFHRMIQDAKIDIVALKAQAIQTVDMDEAYQNIRKVNINHYEFMKLNGTLFLAQDFILGELRLGEKAARFWENFYLHPACLDGSTIVPSFGIFKNNEAVENPFIPLFIESLHAIRKPGKRFYVLAKNNTISFVNDLMYADIEIYTEAGELAVRFNRLASKEIRSRELITKLKGEQPKEANKLRGFQSVSVMPEKVTLPDFSDEGNHALGLKKYIIENLKSMIAKASGLARPQIDIYKGFYELGLDSVHLIQIVKHLEKWLNQQLYPTLLFEYTTVEELAGHLVAEYPEIHTRLKDSKPNEAEQFSPVPVYLYETWESKPIQVFKQQPSTVLFFHSGLSSGLAIEKQFSGSLIIDITPGVQFKKEDFQKYQVNCLSGIDFEQLMSSLAADEIKVEYIIYQCSGHGRNFGEQAIQGGLEKGFFPFFNLVSALIKMKKEKQIKLLYFYQEEQSLNQALSGFAKTACLEAGGLVIKELCLDNLERLDWAEIIAAELFAADNHVFYSGNNRLVLRWNQLEEPQSTPVFRENGTVLITGGMGSLGYIFAEYFAKNHQVNLVLTGRSPLDKKNRERIARLPGDRVVYIQTDISKEADVKTLLRQIRKKFGAVHGIIHTAGVIEDTLIVNKTPAAIQAVLAPKIWGTFYLDEALKDEPLDFFILFSSTSAALGNIGQSDYAYANSFLDQFAGYRNRLAIAGKRRGKTVSIDWSYWKDGGMQLPKEKLQFMKEQLHVVPISTREGIRAFESALQLKVDRFAFIPGDEIKIKELFQVVSPSILTKKRIKITTPAQPGKIKPGQSGSQDIAIIGVAGRYPQAKNIYDFWENLKNGRDCITAIPSSRWDHTRYFDPRKGQPGKSNTSWGGFIDDVDKFDPLLFNITPREAEWMSPQERIFLEIAWETFEDAGYNLTRLRKSKTGVFVGVMWGQYQLFKADISGNYLAPTDIFAAIANRVSYFFDLCAPGMAIDTMCSSTLTALSLACDSIHKGDCHMALVGGINLTIHPEKYLFLSKQGFASSDGRCRSFGEGGDGYGVGEGAGAVLIKSLDRALQDNDRIMAVVKGYALNCSGRTGGFTVPTSTAQAAVIEEAYAQAGLDPASVSYIEAHGTGTSLGDPIEIQGLTIAFSKYTDKKQYCAIGSVKSNIGHCEAAAGIAGLTKILLQMKYKQLVPTLHADSLNPEIPFEKTQFYLQKNYEDWRPQVLDEKKNLYYPRRAGLSSFGAGGANSHIIIEEFIETRFSRNNEESDANSEYLVILSARNRERLREYASKMADFFCNKIDQDQETFSLKETAYTLQTGREEMAERIAFTAGSIAELLAKLNDYIAGKEHIPNFYTGNINNTKALHELVGDGDSGNHFIHSLIQQRDLREIAHLWVSGVAVDWPQLYHGKTIIPVSLPTYPFERKRYWIQESGATFTSEYQLHPLLDNVDYQKSFGNGLVFNKTLKADDQIVKDHQIMGQPVFPGTACLELAAKAGNLIRRDTGCYLSNIFWLKPILVTEPAVDINLVLTGKEQSIDFAISAHGKQAAIGEIHFSSHEGPIKGYLDLETIKKRSFFYQGKKEFYQDQNIGLVYGPSFQWVEEIWSNEEEALSRLKCPESCIHELSEYLLPPTLIDAAIHTSAGIVNGIFKNSDEMPLPFSIEKMEWSGPMFKEGYAYVKAISDHQFHIALFEQQFQTCVKIHNLTVKKGPDLLADFFYMPTWQETSSVPQINTSRERKKILIAYPANCYKFAEGLGRLHQHDQVVKLRLDQKQSFDIGEIQEYGIIYFLGGIGGPEFQANLDGIYQLFRLLRKMAQVKDWTVDPELKIITNNSFEITGPPLNPAGASLHGLAWSAAKELYRIKFTCIDIDLSSPQQITNIDVAKEIASLGSPGDGKSLLLRDNKTYIRAVKPVQLPPQSSTFAFRENGVYLILGGMGGIGFELAKHLAAQVKARLVLCGRSPLDNNKKQKLQEIFAAGGEGIYIQVNAGDEDGMKKAIEQAECKLGPIQAVVHSAGVLHDKILENMEEADFIKVMEAKAKSSIVLYSIFKDKPLDFLLFFSSVQSFLYGAGQANYVAACSFQDAYSHHLDAVLPYPVRVINWGYWGTVGMAATDWFRERSSKYGFYSISPREGMEAIQRILTNEYIQVIPLKAAKAVLQSLGVTIPERIEDPKEKILKPDKQESPKRSLLPHFQGSEEINLRQITLKYVKSVFSNVLKIDPDELEINQTFENYGVDSLMIVEATKQFEQDLGRLSSTLLFEYITIDRLTDYFCTEHRGKLQNLFNQGNQSNQRVMIAQPMDLFIEPESALYPEGINMVSNGQTERLRDLVYQLSEESVDQLLDLLLPSQSSGRGVGND